MAVAPVGQNRPQVAQLEAPEAAAQKSGGGATAVAVARASVTQDTAVRTQLARDAFIEAKPLRAFEEPQQAELEQNTFDAFGTDAFAEPVADFSDFGTQLSDYGANFEEARATEGLDQIQQPTGDPFQDAIGSLMQALNSVVDLCKNILPPEVSESLDSALTGLGGGAGVNPLGIEGPGGPGTQPGAFGVPGINQNDPNLNGNNFDYRFGQTNCAPTALAQIARGKSLEDPNYSLTYRDENGVQQTKRVADMSNEELVSTLGSIAKTDGEGTSPNGVIDAAAAMGFDVSNAEVKFDQNFQPGGPSNSFDQAWLDDKLSGGEKVVVNGAYEGLDEQGNPARIGHFMTIAGKNEDGTYAVMDPWDGQQKNLTPDQLARFMHSNEVNGGIMIAVGDTPDEKGQKAAAAAGGQVGKAIPGATNGAVDQAPQAAPRPDVAAPHVVVQ